MTDKGTQYFYKKFECEICKEPIPLKIQIGNHELDIIDVNKSESSPYLILENLSNKSKDIFNINNIHNDSENDMIKIVNPI